MARRALGPAGLAVAAAVGRALAEHGEDGGPVVVGCSGGADSLALAAGVAEAVRRVPRPARVLVVDHQLQPGSARTASLALQQCRRLGLPGRVVAVQPDGPGGPEARARTARHEALAADAAVDGALVLLGHTLDDQAEQVLLGLSRGSGTRSLAGMRPRRGILLRPLLGLRRADTEAACAEQGLRPWHDPSNTDPGLARSRVRHRVLPLLEAELGPGVVQALARTAELCRLDADALDDQAADQAVGDPPECARLALLPAALRHRVVRRWLVGQGAGQPTRDHVLAVDALVTDWHGQGPIDVPGLAVRRHEGRLLPG